MEVKNALRFVFAGYSVWLEPEQFQGDLDETIQTTSEELRVIPLPAPHATLVYGISHLPEEEVKRRFNELALKISEWPSLEQKAFLTAIEFDGLNGGTMDMSWIEVTFETSEEHELLLNLVHDCFHLDSTVLRQKPWYPHISLAYGNPEIAISPEYLATLIVRFPALQRRRRVKAITLWKTEGTIDQWKCLERIPLAWFEKDTTDDSDNEATRTESTPSTQ